MPTYHYRCSSCAHEFDQFQKFSEDALTECPECGGLIRRVVQPVGIVFKGSGWYINDSRKSGSDSDKIPDAKPAAEVKPSANGDATKPKTSSEKSAPEPKKTPAATGAENS
ncbi:zinc ribbon domain-containing protein [soil metagenome]